MMTVGRLNSLMVLAELLGEPRSLKDLHETLFINRRQKNYPLLLPDGLEQFLRDEVRYGTVRCIQNGTGPMFQINPEIASRVRLELAAALANPIDEHRDEAAA